MAKHDKESQKVVSYDKEYDILFVHNGFSSDEKFKGNIDIGNIILDVSTTGRIRGIEIMNASEFLESFNIKKDMLEHLIDVNFYVRTSSTSIILGLGILAENYEEIPAKIAVPIEAPRGI